MFSINDSCFCSFDYGHVESNSVDSLIIIFLALGFVLSFGEPKVEQSFVDPTQVLCDKSFFKSRKRGVSVLLFFFFFF